MHSDTTHQPSIASPDVVSQPSSVDQQVMGQFTWMPTYFSAPYRRPPGQPSATTGILSLKFGGKTLSNFKRGREHDRG